MTKKTLKTVNTQPVLHFESAKLWAKWLSKNHAESSGCWLQLRKKDSPLQSPTYGEALDVALCYGWIDGQKRSYNEESFIQRFTHRRPKSTWSKINTENAERLIQARKMRAPGLVEIENAKKDGRWEKAYLSQKNMKIPKDFIEALRKHRSAEAFFKTLNRTNLYAIAFRLETAKKPETRAKRFNVILEMLKQGKKFHG